MMIYSTVHRNQYDINKNSYLSIDATSQFRVDLMLHGLNLSSHLA